MFSCGRVLTIKTTMTDFLNTQFYRNHGEILTASFKHLVQQPLLTEAKDTLPIIEQLWQAPFAVVSHGTEGDPIFNFGNKVALKRFDMSFEDFTQLPSRKSAQQVTQAERSVLLQQVTDKGYIDDYTGIRISASGQRFYIENAVVWNLYDQNQNYYGQAAIFPVPACQ